MESKRPDMCALLLVFMAALFLPGLPGGGKTKKEPFPPRPVPARREDAAIMPLFRFGRVDLNSASFRTLARIPGIGPVRARAIIALRHGRSGGLGSLDEITAIRGMGRRAVERLGRWATVRPLIHRER